MTAPEFSSALVQWAASAGYALTPQDPSGAAVFWTDPGGEIRSYIRSGSDGYTITTAERASDEQFDLFAPSMETIERYLVSKFATRVRSRRGLPRLKIPTTVDSIAPGYRVGDADAEGFRTLFDDQGGVVATALGNMSAVTKLVKLSHLVSPPLAEVLAAFDDPRGRPLYTV